MQKHKKRGASVLAFLLAAIMVVTSLSQTVFAEEILSEDPIIETSEISEPSEAQPTAEPTLVPTDAPDTSEEPSQEPEATEAPEATKVPKATEEPEATEAPEATEVPKPTEAPAATEAPQATRTPAPAKKVVARSVGGAVSTVQDLQTAINNSNGTAAAPALITVDAAGITLTGKLTVQAGKFIKLTGGALTRSSNNTGYLFELLGAMTLEGIVLDGNNISSAGAMVYVNGGLLNIESGAVLQHNIGGAIKIVAPGSTAAAITMNGGKIINNSSGSGPAVYFTNSGNMKFTMNGGEISGNTATTNAGAIHESGWSAAPTIEINGGVVQNNIANGTNTSSTYAGAIYSNGTLIMAGGTIEGNSVPNGRGGGIYKGSSGPFTMTGGTVENNTARSTNGGQNIYVGKNVNLSLGGSASIPGGFCSLSSFTILSALTGSIEFEGIPENPSAGKLVAAGATGYTLTGDDCAKLSYENDTYSFRLDTANNQIKLALPQYSISYTLTGMTATDQQTSVDKNESLMVQITVSSGYKLPDPSAVTVKMGGTVLAANKYQLAPMANAYGIYIPSVTGNVEIIMNGVALASNAALNEINCWIGVNPYLKLDSAADLAKAATAEGYTITVPASTADGERLHIYGTKSDAGANIIYGPEGTLGNTPVIVALTVTAEDKTTTKTYRINYQKPSFTVQFDTGGSGTIDEQTIINGGKVTKPIDPVRTGYNFKGWYKDAAFTTRWDFNTDTVSDNLTLYAKLADETVPEAEITLGTDKWNEFLNTVTFGFFFKNTQTVTVSASDAGSGIQSVEYLLSETAFGTADAVTGTWNPLTLSAGEANFSLVPISKQFVYVRATDNDGNAAVINSAGIILYTDADLDTTTAEFNMDVPADIAVSVNLNENTLKEIKNGETVLVKDSEYTVNGETATIKKEYLADALTGDSLVLTFAFNPMGVTTNLVSNTADFTVTKHVHMPEADDRNCATAILCSICDFELTAAKEHVLSDWQNDATNHWKKCTNVGCTHTEQSAAHTPEEDDGDCTTAVLCSVCDYETTAAKEHVLSDWQSDATNHWKKCTNTGCAFTEQKAAHNFGDWFVDTEATEGAKGSKHRDCNICLYSETVEIPVLPHTHKPSAGWSEDATGHWHNCTADDGEKLDLAAHSFGEWVIDTVATETEAGSKHRDCSVCAYTETAEVPSLPHTHKPAAEWSKDAESHWHNCVADDGERLNAEVHRFGTWVVDTAATETTAGKKHRECDICAYREIADIPVLPHTHKPASQWLCDAESHWHNCTANDGTRLDLTAHTPGAASTVEHGQVCTVCGYEMTPKLPSKDMIVDDTTGTKAEYEDGSAFDAEIKLVVTPKSAEEMKEYQDSVDKVANGLSLAGLYDIKLLKDGVAIQPDGKIKITLTLTDEMKGLTELQVVYIDDSGTVSIIPSQLDNDKLIFITDHFSYYGVIGKEAATSTPTPTAKPTENPTPTPAPTVSPTTNPTAAPTTAPTAKPNGPQTGDNSNNSLYIVLCVLSVSGLAALLLKKRRVK